MQLRWSHAAVLVRDMENMLDFYTRVLGFRITDRGPFPGPGGGEIVFLSQVESDHHQFAFVDEHRDDNPPNSVHHFALRVDTLDEVKEMDARLDADDRIGNRLPLTHGNAWSIYFDDPEGNTLEIFCDSPWHAAQPQGEIWDMGKSNDEIAVETRKVFEDNPAFKPIEDFYRSWSEELKNG
ncbi:MAG: hypothetical protein GY724_27180 [Actinomycetia bacterium]|nr:hypothetical protein [Actinomycetes bacterium]MCP4226856.1 hypothetical protein [Actinomycetes bacterium]MCP5030992.1 hypothetical protein [Actinomycetes bacterium]